MKSYKNIILCFLLVFLFCGNAWGGGDVKYEYIELQFTNKNEFPDYYSAGDVISKADYKEYGMDDTTYNNLKKERQALNGYFYLEAGGSAIIRFYCYKRSELKGLYSLVRLNSSDEASNKSNLCEEYKKDLYVYHDGNESNQKNKDREYFWQYGYYAEYADINASCEKSVEILSTDSFFPITQGFSLSKGDKGCVRKCNFTGGCNKKAPTATKTKTPTKIKTATKTPTPTKSTKVPTKTKTLTKTPTPTKTKDPTKTVTKTPAPVVTSSPTIKPTNTPTIKPTNIPTRITSCEDNDLCYSFAIAENNIVDGSVLYVNIPQYIINDVIENENADARGYLRILDENENSKGQKVYIRKSDGYKQIPSTDDNKMTYDIDFGAMADNYAIKISNLSSANKIGAVLYIESNKGDYFINATRPIDGKGSTLPVPAGGFLNISNNSDNNVSVDIQIIDSSKNSYIAKKTITIEPHKNIYGSVKELTGEDIKGRMFYLSNASNQGIVASVKYQDNESGIDVDNYISPLILRNQLQGANVISLKSKSNYKKIISGKKICTIYNRDTLYQKAKVEKLYLVASNLKGKCGKYSIMGKGIEYVNKDNCDYGNVQTNYQTFKTKFCEGSNFAVCGNVNNTSKYQSEQYFNVIYKACMKDIGVDNKNICFYDYGYVCG